MTWVNTPPKEKKEGEEEEGAGDEEGGEEAAEESEPETEQDVPEGEEGEEKPAKKKILPFKESDHHQRVAHASFFNMKNLETLALSAPKTQPLLKVHILCAGIRYGLGEAVFYDHFKNAWLQAPSELPIIGEGKNLIPTIHICDLARVTKRIVAEKVQKEYIFAVDRTPRPTQKRLIQAISNGIGTGKTREMEPDDIADSIIWKDFLSINLKMKTSDVFKDGEAAEDAEDPEAEAAALKFPWHCEKGIFANAKQLNVEFNEARGLNPVKLCVTGPPAAGKTYYAEKIEKYYNIPRVHVKELTDQAFVMAAAEEEEGGDGGDAGALAADIKARVGELREAKAADMTAAIEAEREAMEARGEKVPEDPAEVDPATVSVRIPDEFVYKLL
jgi:adenylate kinase